MSPSTSSFRNSTSGRVECPAVQITGAGGCDLRLATHHSSASLLLDYLDLQRGLHAKLRLLLVQHDGAGELDRFARIELDRLLDIGGGELGDDRAGNEDREVRGVLEVGVRIEVVVAHPARRL